MPFVGLLSLLANSMVERCHTDDLMPNVPISCLPPCRVDPKVQGLNVIIDCPQPGSSRATYRPSPISRWSKCGGNDTVMVLLGSGTSKVSKETQPEWLDPTHMAQWYSPYRNSGERSCSGSTMRYSSFSPHISDSKQRLLLHVWCAVFNEVTAYEDCILRAPELHGKNGRIWRMPSHETCRCCGPWGSEHSQSHQTSTQHRAQHLLLPVICIYTVGHKKRATFIFTITLANVDRFQ